MITKDTKKVVCLKTFLYDDFSGISYIKDNVYDVVYCSTEICCISFTVNRGGTFDLDDYRFEDIINIRKNKLSKI